MPINNLLIYALLKNDRLNNVVKWKHVKLNRAFSFQTNLKVLIWIKRKINLWKAGLFVIYYVVLRKSDVGRMSL